MLQPISNASGVANLENPSKLSYMPLLLFNFLGHAML